jgi:hypothetical protein
LPQHDRASVKSRVLIGRSRQAPIAAAFGNRCDLAAIAIERIGGHDLAHKRDQAMNFDRRLQVAAMVGGRRDRVGGQRQARPGG